jgi:3-keto-disaccharide hydrolase
MTMMRFAGPAVLLAFLLAHAPGGGRALAQGDDLFSGSTGQGDALRGQGVQYRGAAIYYLNSAKARSIDADTEMRFNQYVYESLKEYNRQCALRVAGAAARDKANLDKIQRRFREAPTDVDIADGNALNVLLVELADPRFAAGPRAVTPLPADAIRRVPLQHASAGGILSVHRLTVGGGWPLTLRYRTLEAPRRGYQEAVAAVLGECREHKLTPESVDAVGAAVKELRSWSEEALKVANPDYQAEGRRFVATLDRSARALVRASYGEDLLGEIDAFRDTTVGELTGLLRRYNLHFGPAEEPAERQLYLTLYPILRAEADALGAGTTISVTRVQAARPPTSPDRPEPNGAAVVPHSWSAVRVEGGEAVPLPGLAGWTSRGGTLACTGGGDEWLRSEKLYRDFRLTLEFRMPAGVNSGVHIHCTDRLAGPGNGMEVQIIDEDDERGRRLPAKARTGAIWNVAGPARRATLASGRWNTMEVTCRGDSTRVAVNGITTAEVDASRRPELSDLPRSGYISLENIRGQGRGVEYRSIRIEELD